MSAGLLSIVAALWLGSLFFSSRLSAAEPIDLVTALRLAGAQNLDVQLAREKVNEARAAHQGALMKFYPWLAPEVAWRSHQGGAQNTDGSVIDADKRLATYGPALVAQVEPGEAIYERLATRQLVRAAEAGAEAQRQDAVFLAAEAYFDLVQAQAAELIAADGVRLAEDYARQLQRAVDGGLALKGDALRAAVQQDKATLARQQAALRRELASARLATLLHLDASISLAARNADLAPLSLFSARITTGALVARAQSRPEFARSEALTSAALARRDAAKFAPLYPSVSALAGFGGLRGGPDGGPSRHEDTADFGITLTWRIGPGGLFDRSRRDTAESRVRQAQLEHAKTFDAVTEQVIAAHTAVRSLRAQTATAVRAVTAAQQALALAEQRQEFGLAAVFDRLTAQQELVAARLAHSAVLAAFNKAQYALRRATGGGPEISPAAAAAVR